MSKRDWLEEYMQQRLLERVREHLRDRRDNPPKVIPLPLPDLRKKNPREPEKQRGTPDTQ